MIRIPVPAGVAGPIAVIGGVFLAFAVVVLITAKERTPVSPGTRLGARIVAGIAGAWGLLIALSWLSPSLALVRGQHGMAALLVGVGALALAWGQEALFGAILAAVGGLMITGGVLARMGGHVYGAMLMPSLVLVVLAVILFLRRSRATA
jgi:hypothetical protein